MQVRGGGSMSIFSNVQPNSGVGGLGDLGDVYVRDFTILGGGR